MNEKELIEKWNAYFGFNFKEPEWQTSKLDHEEVEEIIKESFKAGQEFFAKGVVGEDFDSCIDDIIKQARADERKRIEELICHFVAHHDFKYIKPDAYTRQEFRDDLLEELKSNLDKPFSKGFEGE